MTVEKARRVCDALSDVAETLSGERAVACLNFVEQVEDELDAEGRADWEETQLDERVEELTRFVVGKFGKRKEVELC